MEKKECLNLDMGSIEEVPVLATQRTSNHPITEDNGMPNPGDIHHAFIVVRRQSAHYKEQVASGSLGECNG